MIKITIEIPGKKADTFTFEQILVFGIERGESSVSVQAACSGNFLETIREEVIPKVMKTANIKQ